MKLKEYFNNPKIFSCPFCKAMITPVRDIVNHRYGHMHDGKGINFLYTNQKNNTECIWLKVFDRSSWLALNFYQSSIFIIKNDSVGATIPYDCLNCEKDIKEFNEEWAANLLVFS